MVASLADRQYVARVEQRTVRDEHGHRTGRVQHGHRNAAGDFIPAPTLVAAVCAAHAANVEVA